MLTAFSTADELQKEAFANFLNLEKVTAVAKSQSMGSYERTYQCQAQAICYAVQNPEKHNIIPNSIGKCHNTSVEELEKTLKTDFSGCYDIQSYATERYFAQCEEFKDIKIKKSQMFLTNEFMTEVHLENKSLLAEKVLDLRKKMSILIEKVRYFSINFNKVIADISCTDAAPSGE